MSAVTWGHSQGVTVPDDGAQTIVTVAVTDIDVWQPVMLVPVLSAIQPDADTTLISLQVFRSDNGDDQIGPTVALTVTDGAVVPAAGVNPAVFDGPGLPENQSYVLVIVCNGATGPSTGIDAALVATHN